jgi:hypothetical protein
MLLCLRSLADGDPGALSGTVFNAGGDPVPFARITLIHRQSGFERLLIAGKDGKYAAPDLPAGSYTVMATSVAAGIRSDNIVINQGQRVDLVIVLAAIAGLGDSPLSGRPYLDFIRDEAQITPGQEGGDIEGYGPYGFRGNTSFNSVGQRGQNNNFLFDGMDNNDNWLGGEILDPSIEAIAAVSVLAGYTPAEFGHATGAAVNAQTRSGSNQPHGSAYDYLQNSAPDARNFFDGARKPSLVSNQFGGQAGGPIRKDDWFYFGDAEWLRARQDLTVISTVPTAAQKAGNFGVIPVYDPLTIAQITPNVYVRQPFPNNLIPLSRISAASQRLLTLYPDPNLPGNADNYRFTPASIRDGERYDLRSDKRLSSGNSLFARLSYQSGDVQSPGAFPAGGSDIAQHANDGTTKTLSWGAMIADSFTISPRLIDEIRIGSAAIDLRSFANDQGVNASGLLDIPGLGGNGLPSILPEGFTSLGAAEPIPLQIRSSNYQVEDTVAWTTSRQALRFGVQAIRRHADGDASTVSDRGAFLFTPDYTSVPGSPTPTGDSMASLLLGYPSEVQRDVQFTPFQLRAWEWSGFAQDQVRIWKRLSIQAGLRCSLYPPLTEANGRMVNFSFNTGAPALDRFAGQAGVNQYAGLGSQERAISPQIGFAWDLVEGGATVLRGGFSKSYDPGAYIAEGSLARNAPYASQLDMINGTFQLGPNLTSGLPIPTAIPLTDTAALVSSHQAVNAIQQATYTPYADQWDLFLQQRLYSRLLLEVGGAGSMGIHLLAAYDSNEPYPAPSPYATPRYPFDPYEGRVNYLNFGGGSTYYGGQMKLTGRVTSGLSVILSYAYAKSLDDSVEPDTNPESRPSVPQYIYDPRGNRSPSPFDITHRMVLIGHYDVPFRGAGTVLASRLLSHALANWSVSALVTAQTGFPFTPELAANSLNNGGFQLPDRIGNGALPPDRRSYLDWFNTSLGPAGSGSAFVVPPLYQYGNSGFDILRGPALVDAEAALYRTFALREQLRLQARMEASNLLNHANLALPGRLLGVESSGVISHTITPARQFQVAVKVLW